MIKKIFKKIVMSYHFWLIVFFTNFLWLLVVEKNPLMVALIFLAVFWFSLIASLMAFWEGEKE